MARHLLRATTALASVKGPAQGQPGSNGYWRRDQFSRSGTATWTAKKTGKVKVQAIGAGAGCHGQSPGASGGYGEKEFNVVAGEVYTIVTGKGGAGLQANANATSPAGGTTSISGPGLASPLVIAGATGSVTTGSQNGFTTVGQGGVPSGPWDKSFVGANALGVAGNYGGSSSASPKGAGYTAAGGGGAGWGGTANVSVGASSHFPPNLSGQGGTPGLSTIAPSTAVSGGTATTYNLPTADQSQKPFWDLNDVDSAGGVMLNSQYGVGVGPGAGTASCQYAVPSTLGGGTGFCNGTPIGSGYGAGAPATGAAACPGGDAIVFIFSDEVAA